MGGVLAELLANAGKRVTIVTPEPLVSAWTVNTMEQRRIHARLHAAGVTITLSQALSAAGPDGIHVRCVFTDQETTLDADALVLVTARLPNDELVAEMGKAGRGPATQAIGDALAPSTIANAVWDGHRYAEELDDPVAEDRDGVPFRREIIALPQD
jgi:dimethylamine/trimethylamine dehydrogenase